MTQPAGAVPDRRHRRDDEAADQDVAPDRQHRPRIPTVVRDAFRVARRSGPGRCIWSCPEDIAGEEAQDRAAGAAAPDRAAGRAAGGARPGGGDDPARPKRPLVMLGAAASRPRLDRRADRVRPPHPDSRSSTRRWARARCAGGHQSLHGHGRAVGAGLRPRGDRPGRPDRRDRPRHDREAAVPHGAGRAAGDPHRLSRRRTSSRSTSRMPRWWATLARAWRCSPTGSRASCRTPRALLPLREADPERIGDRATEEPLPADAAAHRPRRARGDAGRRHRRASTTACTRSGSRATTAPDVANTLLLDNALATMGAGLPVGDDGGHAVSGPARAWRCAATAAS